MCIADFAHIILWTFNFTFFSYSFLWMFLLYAFVFFVGVFFCLKGLPFISLQAYCRLIMPLCSYVLIPLFISAILLPSPLFSLLLLLILFLFLALFFFYNGDLSFSLLVSKFLFPVCNSTHAIVFAAVFFLLCYFHFPSSCLTLPSPLSFSFFFFSGDGVFICVLLVCHSLWISIFYFMLFYFPHYIKSGLTFTSPHNFTLFSCFNGDWVFFFFFWFLFVFLLMPYFNHYSFIHAFYHYVRSCYTLTSPQCFTISFLQWLTELFLFFVCISAHAIFLPALSYSCLSPLC